MDFHRITGLSLLALLLFSSCDESIKHDDRKALLHAYREAPIGGIWLTLYDGNEFELKNSPREVAVAGQYTINGDTITLIKNDGKESYQHFNQVKLLISDTDLVELTETGIAVLEIQENKLNNKKLAPTTE